MSYTSDFLNPPNVSRVTLSEAVAFQAPVVIGPKGLGVQAVCTDYATVAAKATSIVAPTLMSSTRNTSFPRPPVLVGDDRSIFTVVPKTSVGATVYRYSPTGTLIGSVDLNTASTICTGIQMQFLANGNIVVLLTQNSLVYAAILSQSLAIVTAVTNLSVTLSTNPMMMTLQALSGGGFAVAVCGNTSVNGTCYFSIWSNTATSVFGSTSIKTNVGGDVRLAELSNGNILLVINSVTATGAPGVFFAIRNAAGAQVVAATSLTTTSTTLAADIGVGDGYFYVSPNSVANCYVVSNAGVVQTGFSTSSAVRTSIAMAKWLTDATNAYLLYVTASTLVMVQIPLGGTAAPTVTSWTVTIPATFDATWVGGAASGLIAVAYQDTTQPKYLVVSTTSPTIYQSAQNVGSAATTGGSVMSVTDLGDFTIGLCYDWANTVGSYLSVYTAADKGLLGVALAAGAAAVTIPVTTGAGNFGFGGLTLGGTISKTFDHTAATVPANKGTLGSSGISMTGI